MPYFNNLATSEPHKQKNQKYKKITDLYVRIKHIIKKYQYICTV
jgi:hypothetical protein